MRGGPIDIRPSWTGSWLARYGGATLIVALSSICSDLFFRITGTPRLSSIFLAGVVLAAVLFGSGPAYWSAALSFFVYLWIVDPRYTFQFGSSEDFDTLMTFAVVAGLMGLLIGRIRDEAVASEARAAMRDTLLEATQEFSSISDEEALRERLARRVARAAHGQAFVRERLKLTTWPATIVGREVALESTAIDRKARGGPLETAPAGSWMFRALRTGEEHFGVVGWRTMRARPLNEEHRELLDVLIDTGAAAIARIRLAEAKSEAEARARTEDLRNALLSSVSHDVRTPLAAILASATSLQEFGDSFDAATRKDLAATIQEEAIRLDAFVGNLLNMSRLEAGALNVQPCAFNVPEVVSRTIQRRGRNLATPVTVSIAPDLPEALGDPLLFEQVLGNVFENALRHGGGAVSVAAQRQADLVTVEVRDDGPGVPEEDMGRLFDKFYRAPSNTKPGTGLGLSIVRGLMQAMGGAVEARNIGERAGLAVVMLLPAAA